jgi:hypothetical protein
MTSSDTVQGSGFFGDDTWLWWQARRLRYNMALAGGGWGAYGAAVGLHYAFGDQVWRDWRAGLGMTIFLGVAYLIVMGFANVLYLLGPAVESWVKPADVGREALTETVSGAAASGHASCAPPVRRRTSSPPPRYASRPRPVPSRTRP